MRRLTIEDLLNYKYLSALVASPDKKKCAFIVSQCNEKKNCYDSSVYVFDRQTRRTSRYTTGGAEKNVLWLDNTTLLFQTMRNEELAKKIEAGESWSVFYALSFAGGEAQEYMRIPRIVTWLRPLGCDRFALLADFNLYEDDPMDHDGEEREKALKARAERDVSYIVADEMPFRKDGRGITSGRRSRLYVFDRTTQKLWPVSGPEQQVEFVRAEGSRIIYSAKRFTKDKPYIFLSNIAIYDADTGLNREYVDDMRYRVHSCGFQGTKPFFLGSDGLRYGYQENSYFYWIDEITSKVILFARNELSASNSVGTDSRYGSGDTVAADQDFVYYVGTEGGDAYLKRVDAKGRFETLTGEGGSIDSIALCGNEIIFVGMQHDRLPELYSLKDGVEKKLTDFNDWVQSEITLSRHEFVDFSNDGIRLQGFLIKPVDWRPGESYPGILYIHGGHKLTFGSVFYHEMQVWANQGYYVFYCNPRGSDGRDNVFANIIGKYGVDDYSDIMKFTDVCLEKYPGLDSHRLGVGGGSYGGYMTNWIIGHTDRFKCAVSQRGIASFISMFGTSDTSYQFPLWQFDTDLWMDIDRYWEHSPLKYADCCKTPTLFLHSENDYRCPVSEGIQMFYALKYHGIESRLCIFKNEGHELSRAGKPRNRINRLKLITDWFNSHLKQ